MSVPATTASAVASASPVPRHEGQARDRPDALQRGGARQVAQALRLRGEAVQLVVERRRDRGERRLRLQEPAALRQKTAVAERRRIGVELRRGIPFRSGRGQEGQARAGPDEAGLYLPAQRGKLPGALRGRGAPQGAPQRGDGLGQLADALVGEEIPVGQPVEAEPHGGFRRGVQFGDAGGYPQPRQVVLRREQGCQARRRGIRVLLGPAQGEPGLVRLERRGMHPAGMVLRAVRLLGPGALGEAKPQLLHALLDAADEAGELAGGGVDLRAVVDRGQPVGGAPRQLGVRPDPLRELRRRDGLAQKPVLRVDKVAIHAHRGEAHDQRERGESREDELQLGVEAPRTHG